jgi:hypothetical protein
MLAPAGERAGFPLRRVIVAQVAVSEASRQRQRYSPIAIRRTALNPPDPPGKQWVGFLQAPAAQSGLLFWMQRIAAHTRVCVVTSKEVGAAND